LDDRVPVLRDLALSCRIAKKKVEHAWFQWIADQLAAAGAEELHAWYKPTPRNRVLRDALVEMGFSSVGNAHDHEVLALAFDRPIEDAEIVQVTAEGLPLPLLR